ncbi:class I SAM-dependent methyltransferase [Aeoliella sp.]|uniref:class I SAM-dependent methyltransferase n=1 Tax=Aeoliella sp. TaxID=2795800 RepID=UPI003CCBDC15
MPNSTIRLFALLMLCCSAAHVVAQEAAEEQQAEAKEQAPQAPPAPPEYMGRQIAQTMHYAGAPWLVRESREREEECSKLLKALEIKPRQTVCDLGCGNGFYTLKMAKLVGPKGTVWAVDIQPEMLELLDERATARGVTNLEPTLGTAISPNVPKGKLDLVLLVDVYHEFSHPKEMLSAIRDSLKPTGRVALVEYRTEDPEVPIKRLHKMSQQQVMKEYQANGFKLVGQYDELPWQHVFFFARDDSELEEVELKRWEKKEEAKE